MMKDLDQTLPAGRELEVERDRYNEAVILLFFGRFDEAEAIIRKQRERWEELASTSPWTYYAVMSGIEAFKGELESSLQTAMKVVAVAEHERIYGPACGLLQRVGALADRTGNTEMPRIFAILRPVAFALHGLGRTGEACRLALAVPGLMAESRFAYSDQFRERSLWEPLTEPCCGAEPEPLTLSEVCETVRAMVHVPSGTAVV